MSGRSSSRVSEQQAAKSERNKEENEKAEKLREEKGAAAALKKEAAAAKKKEKEDEEEKKKALVPKLKLTLSKTPAPSVSAKVDKAMEAYQKALAESLPVIATVNSALITDDIPIPRPAPVRPPPEKKPVMTSLMAAAMGETYIPGPEDLPKAPKQRKKYSTVQHDTDSDKEKDDVNKDDKKKGSGKRARSAVIDDSEDDDDDEEDDDEKPAKKVKKAATVKAEPESRREAPRPIIKAAKKPEGGPMQKYVQGGKKESKPKESRPLPSIPLPLPSLPIRPHRAPTPEDVIAAQGLANQLHQATESRNWKELIALLSPTGAIAQLPKTIELSSTSTIAMRLRSVQSASSIACNEAPVDSNGDGSNVGQASEALQLCNSMLSLFKEECKAIVEWEKNYKISFEELQIVEKKNAEIEARAAAVAAKAAAKEAERAAAKQAEIELREARLAQSKSGTSEASSAKVLVPDQNMEDSALFSEEKTEFASAVPSVPISKTEKHIEKHQEKSHSVLPTKPPTVAVPMQQQKAVASTASLLKGVQQSTKVVTAPATARAPSNSQGGILNSSSVLSKELALPWPSSSETIEIGPVLVPNSVRSTVATLLHALFQETALWPASPATPTSSENVQRWLSRITERLAISAENKLYEATQQQTTKSTSTIGSAEPILMKLQRSLDTLLVSARDEKNRPASESSDLSTPRAVSARQLYIALQETGVKARTSVLSSSSSSSSSLETKEDEKQRDAIFSLLPLLFSVCAQVCSQIN